MLRYVLVCLVLTKVVTLSAQNSALIDSILHTLPTYRQAIASNPDPFEIQVYYKPLSGPDAGNTYRWNVDPSRYFYPASTVKLPAAILTLQWMSDQQIQGLSPSSVVLFGTNTSNKQLAGQPFDTSRTTVSWQPSLENFIHDAMVVSDNEAYNKLFDLLGPHYLNDELWRRGWNTRIVHRVGQTSYPTQANSLLPPVKVLQFIHEPADPLFFRASAFAKTPYKLSLVNEHKGLGRFDDESKKVIPGGFDFSEKNFVALEDLAEMLQAVVAPETIDSLKRFRIFPAWRDMLLTALSTRPAESRNPAHHTKPDGYVNFLYYGGDGAWEKDGPLIYNKVGDAYGYLTEAAVFENRTSGLRYVLAATIHVNANGIYNDGVYEYDTIGFPFLEELGRAIWDYANRR